MLHRPIERTRQVWSYQLKRRLSVAVRKGDGMEAIVYGLVGYSSDTSSAGGKSSGDK